MNLEPGGDYHREESQASTASACDGFPGTTGPGARSRSHGKSSPACFPCSPLLSGESSLSVWGDWSLYRQPLQGHCTPHMSPCLKADCSSCLCCQRTPCRPSPLRWRALAGPVFFRATQGVSVFFLCELSNFESVCRAKEQAVFTAHPYLFF